MLGEGFHCAILPAFVCLKISKIEGQTKPTPCLKATDNIENTTYKYSFVVYRAEMEF